MMLAQGGGGRVQCGPRKGLKLGVLSVPKRLRYYLHSDPPGHLRRCSPRCHLIVYHLCLATASHGNWYAVYRMTTFAEQDFMPWGRVALVGQRVRLAPC